MCRTPSLSCSIGKVCGSLPVIPLKVLRARHQMDEVIGRVDATHCLIERRSVQHIALDDLGRFFNMGPELLRVAGQAAEFDRLLFEQRDEPAADIARGTCEKNEGLIFFWHWT